MSNTSFDLINESHIKMVFFFEGSYKDGIVLLPKKIIKGFYLILYMVWGF